MEDQFFSPVIIVPAVCVVGLGLFERGFPQVAKCVEIGLPMLLLLVIGQQSTGAFYAAARLAGATPPPAHVLSRSIGLQGVGMLLEGIFGAAVGTTASVENVGLLGLTQIGSRRVVQISTGFMIFFSIFATIGISFIQFTNNNSMRNIYIMGLSLFLAISVPQYFNEFTVSAGNGPVKTNAGWFNDILNSIFSSSPTVALLVGTILDNTLDAMNTAEDRGLPWWIPFQKRNGDVRNDEFYSFPIKVHEYIPTRYL
ncbi:Nucleobase-ascorbate transporter 3 [Acorus gramineus]|uniref:Nucleobase-ascorbate transporter 3 n=1 Tax=Acorus gramineus TaxID=55184 RepID=A0AAV9AY05_ACOGR|nr:Nucleobase-ascorbate transporter 3 [Acorus gramineus]